LQPLTTEELRLKQAEDEVVQLIKRRKQVLKPPPPSSPSRNPFHSFLIFSIRSRHLSTDPSFLT
jgi:hypothetical protein